MSRAERRYHLLVVWLVLLILMLPLLATLGYALATEWARPFCRRLTLKWFTQLWSDSRFLVALGHSLLICFGALLFSLLLVLPAMFVIAWAFPKLDGLMNVLILLPFAVPPVVSSVGLLQLYSAEPLALTGTLDSGRLLFHHRTAVYLPRHRQQHAGHQLAGVAGRGASARRQYLAGGAVGGAAQPA